MVGEFEDSEENYNEFLFECKRVLKNQLDIFILCSTLILF